MVIEYGKCPGHTYIYPSLLDSKGSGSHRNTCLKNNRFWYCICLTTCMKKIKLLLIVVSICGMASAQTRKHAQGKGPVTPVRVGSTILNLGIGVGAEYNGDYYRSAFGTKIAAEWGLWQAGPGVITLGPELGGSFSRRGYHDDYRTRTIVVAMRSAWHYGWKVPGLDTYGGLSAGIGFHHWQYRDNQDYSDDKVLAVPGIFIGASYFVTPMFGFNAEAGYDITNFQVGIVFKLK